MGIFLPRHFNLAATMLFPYFIKKQNRIKMKFSIKDFSSKCDQIHKELRNWLRLLKKSSIENFLFCAVPINEHLLPLIHTKKLDSKQLASIKNFSHIFLASSRLDSTDVHFKKLSISKLSR